MSSVIFDIETLGYPLESFDAVQQEYLLKFADTEEKREAEVQKLSLHAATAQIVAIGMLNPESMAGKVFYQSTSRERHKSPDNNVEFIPGDEREILEGFWQAVQHYQRFITFNGRTFDCPFLMLRSAIVGVVPTRNLMPYRYDARQHCDLLDQMTFYGATRKFNLDFYCKAFGIPSPKEGGITGHDVAPLFHEGKFREIAAYCLGDVVATAELFRRWDKYITIKE